MNDDRRDLIRMVPLPAAEFRAEGDGNTLVGFPIVFNKWTEIAGGWEGRFMERIAPTALDKTLQERGEQVKVLFNHGFDPQIGDKPLGKPAIMEPQERGLWTETPLADTSYNKDIKELLRVGAIDGMSFRFTVVKEEIDSDPEASEDNPHGLEERTVTELKLYEFGPVTFPAYSATSVGVRNAQGYELYRKGLYSPNPVELVGATEAGALDATTSAGDDTRMSRFQHSSASKALYVLRATESLKDPRNDTYPKR